MACTVIGSPIVVKMPPFAKERPRAGKNVYMRPEYKAKKELLGYLYMERGGEINPPGLLELYLTFVLRMPQSWSRQKIKDMLYKPCGKRPDLDNLEGAVMDSLISDDSKVVSMVSRKVWGLEDEIRIKIERVSDE